MLIASASTLKLLLYIGKSAFQPFFPFFLLKMKTKLSAFLALCLRRGWSSPSYKSYPECGGYSCRVLVNEREYHTDIIHQSASMAMENAATRAFMKIRSFSAHGGMVARNGIVQGVIFKEARRSARQPPRSPTLGLAFSHDSTVYPPDPAIRSEYGQANVATNYYDEDEDLSICDSDPDQPSPSFTRRPGTRKKKWWRSRGNHSSSSSEASSSVTSLSSNFG
ncbi:hypothetical protein F5Y16DRAFT_379252 [Xylariaceae sp. FL0255]|nr:hypothetical protein F5Y16DRAFT_379252 [Xylariaceae sp. FL0255]